MLRQRTIHEIVRATGIGLHSGTRVVLSLRPAPPDTGIVFRRIDCDPPVDLPANALSIGDTRMASTLQVGDRPGFHDRAPDVGMRRTGHRQPAMST